MFFSKICNMEKWIWRDLVLWSPSGLLAACLWNKQLQLAFHEELNTKLLLKKAGYYCMWPRYIHSPETNLWTKYSPNIWEWWKQAGRTTCQTCFYLFLYLFSWLFHGTESTQPWLVSFLGKKTKAQIRCDRLIAARCSCFRNQDRLRLSDEKCCWGRQTGPRDAGGREREPGGDGGRYEMKMKQRSVGLSAVTFCK